MGKAIRVVSFELKLCIVSNQVEEVRDKKLVQCGYTQCKSVPYLLMMIFKFGW